MEPQGRQSKPNLHRLSDAGSPDTPFAKDKRVTTETPHARAKGTAGQARLGQSAGGVGLGGCCVPRQPVARSESAQAGLSALLQGCSLTKENGVHTLP